MRKTCRENSMKVLQSAAVLLWVTGAMMSSCAQAQERPIPSFGEYAPQFMVPPSPPPYFLQDPPKPPPAPAFGEAPPPPPPPKPSPFGEDPPDPPRPPREQDDRREKIERLENEIRELEGALKRDDVPDERRAALKERLGERRRVLKDLL